MEEAHEGPCLPEGEEVRKGLLLPELEELREGPRQPAVVQGPREGVLQPEAMVMEEPRKETEVPVQGSLLNRSHTPPNPPNTESPYHDTWHP